MPATGLAAAPLCSARTGATGSRATGHKRPRTHLFGRNTQAADINRSNQNLLGWNRLYGRDFITIL